MTPACTRLFLASEILTAALALEATPAFAEDTFRVVGVESPDVLNVRAGPSTDFAVIGSFPPGAEGITSAGGCSERWCLVTDGSVTGWVNMRFLERVSETVALQVEGASPTHAVLPDGTLEIRFADGRVRRRLPDGNVETVLPDGSRLRSAYVQSPSAGLPPLPADLSGWGVRVNDRLRSILTNILTPAEMQAYEQTEVGLNLDDTVVWRLRSIEFLTASN